MKTIELIAERITEELDDSKYYIEKALEYKDSHPDLSRTMYDLSLQEEGHAKMLRTAVEKMIDDCKRQGHELPEGMMYVYDYLHKKQMKEHEHIKCMQSMYNG